MKPSGRNNNKYKELLRKMQILSKNLLSLDKRETNSWWNSEMYKKHQKIYWDRLNNSEIYLKQPNNKEGRRAK